MKTGLRHCRSVGWGGAVARAGGAIAQQASVAIALPLLCLVVSPTSAVLAQLAAPPESQPQLKTTDCPPQDLSVLINQLMLDLPSYSNRVIQRASSLGDSSPLYLMLAGQPEIRPVSLEAFANHPNRSRLPVNQAPKNAPIEEIYQIRFTTLERQYVRTSTPASPSIEQTLAQAAPSFQQFHRLILARQQNRAATPEALPWQIVSLRSQLVPYPNVDDRLLAPARNSRRGSVGQGMALWFRDWHGGAIRLSTENLASSSGGSSHCLTP